MSPSEDRRPKILLTNDDGYAAPGLNALAEALSSVGRVMVVAPQGAQSAVSHTITLHKPLRVWEEHPGVFVCSGSPADCVYLGVHALCPPDDKPDLVVSGINHGPNLGNDVFYSGTVAGAMEGCLLGYPAIAVSQSMTIGEEFSAETEHEPIDYRPGAELTRRVVSQVLARGLDQGILLNINIPARYRPERGLRVVRLGRRIYGESFFRRLDPRGRPYYWIGGADVIHADIPGSDCTTLEAGYATVTPLRADLTDTDAMAAMAGFLEDEPPT